MASVGDPNRRAGEQINDSLRITTLQSEFRVAIVNGDNVAEAQSSHTPDISAQANVASGWNATFVVARTNVRDR